MVGPGSPEKRYELVERIAVGGMAEVFRAKAYGPHGFEKVLAIKRILPGLAADPKFERRFIAEAKLAVSLSHANIVQVLDFSRFGQSLYIVMEYIDGGDLARVLQIRRERGAPVPLSAGVHVAVELLKGLDFAHRRGVVHRDVSPSNILLSRAGEVKIADFGIAQAVGFEHSRSMRIMGKWRYMSPEQAQGEELDARSDVFSAGVVLFELLTGQRLFPGTDAEEIVRNLRTMPLPRPSLVRPDLPPEMDAPLAAALERDRAARTVTAAQLLSALVEVCYAHSMPALPTELARFLDELAAPVAAPVASGQKPGPGSDSGRGSPAALLDQIIYSEVHPGQAAAARAARPGGSVRRTAMALGPPAVAPEDVPRDPADPMTAIGATFIRSVADLDGTTRWELADAPRDGDDDGDDPANDDPANDDPDDDDPDDDSDGDDGDLTRAVDVVAPDTPVPMLLPRIPPSIPPSIPSSPGTVQRVLTPHPAVPIQLDPPRPRLERTPAPRPPRRWIGASVAIAAVAVVIGLVALRSSDSSRGDEPEAGPESSPGATAPSAPPSAPTAPPSAPPSAPTAPAVARRLPAPSAAPDRARPRPRPEPAPRERTGSIDIYSEPWANIYLGKRKVGVAPQRGVKLPVGRHRLHLVNPVLRRSAWVTVSVPSGRPVRVELRER
ncbi:MAG TPA: serine/threonine-protein kinase [Kofleriaceae bacterium]|nr:serine/threonine-protein kinase [Kofleriaceae bacterium]